MQDERTGFGNCIAQLENALVVAEPVDALLVPLRERVLRALVASLHAEHGLHLGTPCRIAAPISPVAYRRISRRGFE
jgi:hypothetical protein